MAAILWIRQAVPNDKEKQTVMVLPFIIAMVAIVCILLGRIRLGIWAWSTLMIVYLGWCKYHMTDALALTL